MKTERSFFEASFHDIFVFQKGKMLAGGLLALAVLILYTAFYTVESGLLYAALFLFFGAVRIKEKNRVLTGILYGVLALILFAFLCNLSTSMTGGREFTTLGTKAQQLNLLIVFVLFAFLFSLLGGIRSALIVGSVFLVLFSAANHFIYGFRGKELCPLDFLSLGTAANVASQYKLVVKQEVADVFATLGVYLFLLFSLPRLSISSRLRARLFSFTLAFIGFACIFSGAARIPIKTWSNQGSSINGYYLNFCLGVRDSFVSAPKNYSPDLLTGMENQYPVPEQTAKELPNIIVIMNESFADFDLFGEVFSSENEFTPFLSELTENTVRGYALTSVFGGNTANAEFEFLTNHSMAFLPNGSVAYQQYVSGELLTLASQLADLGYESYATHPYYANGWNRNKIYPQLGFLASSFIEDYPMKKVLRDYASDEEVYDTVLDKLAKKSDAPLFLFGITMQNHGGYDYSGENWQENETLSGFTGSYPLAEQYFALIKESDRSFASFIQSIKKVPEKTLVLMFGDHFPGIENKFYAAVCGGEVDTLDEKMCQYNVPFYLFANYDIEEKQDIKTSLNFLSCLLLEQAGIEPSPLHQFLSDMQKVIPAMNTLGFYSNEQNRFVSYEEASEHEQMWLDRYASLQYNHLFDKSNKNTHFFH